MKYDITHGPAFALLNMDMDRGEEVRCESGAMVSMSASLTIEGRMNAGEGGFFSRAVSAVTRSTFGGETFFITTVTANSGPGHLALAPAIPGDVTDVDISNRSLIIQRGGYLAGGPGLSVETSWGGLKSLLGGEGLVLLKATGRGTVFLASFGGIFARRLAPGEEYIVDSGHMVAFEEGMAVETGLAARPGRGGFFSRAITSATTGEGLVMTFTGPGTVWIQTRNPDAFSGWLQTLLPPPRSGSNG